MWNKIKNLFIPTKQSHIKPPSEDTMVDVIVSLNKKFEISIQLFLDDKLKDKNISQTEYSLVCAEFLNIIMSGKIKSQILDIIMNQIRNNDNKILVDSILGYIALMEDKITIANNNAVIKPTQVFAKYKNG